MKKRLEAQKMENSRKLIDAVRFEEILKRYRNSPHVTMMNPYSQGMWTAINSCLDLLENQPEVVVESLEVHDGK